MNTFLRCSVVATTLAFAGASVAQTTGPQTPATQPYVPAQVTFGVLNPYEPVREQADPGATDQPGNEQNRLMEGQFFVEGPPAEYSTTPPRSDTERALRRRYPDVADTLDLDTATADKLFELLAEQQLDTLAASRLNTPRLSFDWLLGEADAEGKRLDALRGLLGEERLERYLDYSTTLLERTQVRTFDARLPSEHKLLPAQKEQMIALYREVTVQHSRELRGPRSFGGYRSQFPAIEDLRRASQLATIAANEEQLRTMSQSHRWLAQRAAEFLNEPQLAALSRLHAEEQNSLRHWIENARLAAGLEPGIPAHPLLSADEPSGERTPAAVQVRMDIRLTVDRHEPQILSQVATNGEPVAFEGPDGLLVEATPTLYDDGSLDVELAYYEQRGPRKRRLTDRASVSSLRAPEMPMEIEKLTVTAGNKVYAIKATVSVAVM